MSDDERALGAATAALELNHQAMIMATRARLLPWWRWQAKRALLRGAQALMDSADLMLAEAGVVVRRMSP